MKKLVVVLVAAAALGGASVVDASAADHSCTVPGGWVSAGQRTSCPFARNVVRKAVKTFQRQWRTSFRMNVWSPVTYQWYVMRCKVGLRGRRTDYDCWGGNDSYVSWWVS